MFTSKMPTRIIVLAALLVMVLVAGCEFTYNGYTIDCTHFEILITSGTATIDNTGTGDERVGIRAVDGAGNTLYYNDNYREHPLGPIGWFPSATFVYWERAPLFNPITLTYFNPAGGTLAQEQTIATFSGECPGLPTFADGDFDGGVFDGRINRYEIAAPIALYAVPIDGVDGLYIYTIDDAGEGALVLIVTPDMITAVPDLPENNTLIASTDDGSVAFYRLSTGEYQVNAGSYVVIFDSLSPQANTYMPQ